AMPNDARDIYNLLQKDARDLAELLQRLDRSGVRPFDTIAFQFKDGIVDDVVGLAWDSFHVDLQGGGEALFYNALANDEQRTNSSGNTVSYAARQTRLDYDIQPIVLAHLSLNVKFDWAHWADAA